MIRRLNPNQSPKESDPLYELALEKTKTFKGKHGTVEVDGKQYKYGAMEYFEGPELMYLITVECEGIQKVTKQRSTIKGYAVCYKAIQQELQQKN